MVKKDSDAFYWNLFYEDLIMCRGVMFSQVAEIARKRKLVFKN
jgi:hypothetical protein